MRRSSRHGQGSWMGAADLSRGSRTGGPSLRSTDPIDAGTQPAVLFRLLTQEFQRVLHVGLRAAFQTLGYAQGMLCCHVENHGVLRYHRR